MEDFPTWDPPLTEYMYMQACILSKMNGDSDLLGNVIQDFTQAQKKKFKRLHTGLFQNQTFQISTINFSIMNLSTRPVIKFPLAQTKLYKIHYQLVG